MEKYLNGSPQTGKKILKNRLLFSYELTGQDMCDDGALNYYFKWIFGSQHGEISITVKDQKISHSSLIRCDNDSPNKFPSPLGVYKDDSLKPLFTEMLQKNGIETVGFYSDSFKH